MNAHSAQRERARAHSQFGQRQTADLGIAGCTEFHGYDRVEETATVVALLCLFVGYPLAYVIARARGARLRLMMALAECCLQLR